MCLQLLFWIPASCQVKNPQFLRQVRIIVKLGGTVVLTACKQPGDVRSNDLQGAACF